MQLSKNFSLKEMTKSMTATRKGIDNNPTSAHLENLSNLCTYCLQPIRDKAGSIKINSGYRSEALNEAIGGSWKSQHMKGEAADIEARSMSNKSLFALIIDEGIYDQVILEFYSEDDPEAGWVHVSYKHDGTNRREKLVAFKDENGHTKYRKINDITEV